MPLKKVWDNLAGNWDLHPSHSASCGRHGALCPTGVAIGAELASRFSQLGGALVASLRGGVDTAFATQRGPFGVSADGAAGDLSDVALASADAPPRVAKAAGRGHPLGPRSLDLARIISIFDHARPVLVHGNRAFWRVPQHFEPRKQDPEPLLLHRLVV